MKLLLYCTKAKPYLYGMYSGFETRYGYHLTNDKNVFNAHNVLNGKIVAECDFEVEEIKPEKYWHSTEDFDYIYNTGTIYYEDLLKKSCLMDYELDDYLGCEDKGYAIHIKNLYIFDKPRDLRDYYTNRIYTKIEDVYTDEIQINGSEWVRPIKQAPQNMMYAFDGNLQPYTLISIKPEWLYKILNGEKTIEVRKKVLKEMIK